MNRLLLTLFCFFIIVANVYSQVLPREGSKLNYRLIGFSISDHRITNTSEIQIASGNQLTEYAFKQNIIKTVTCKAGRAIAEVPSFGENYTWRSVTKNGNKTTCSELHHFATSFSAKIDTAITKLTVTRPCEKYKKAYVFVDESEALFDMDGHPVWYLPEQFEGVKGNIRDLKLTSRGTITFLAVSSAYEINMDGGILWKAPDNGIVSGMKTESYHHEFTRLSNGNYMVLGKEMSNASLYNSDKTLKLDTNGKPMFVPLMRGTVIEYNKKGDVVWSWKSSKYINESDLVNYYSSASGNNIQDLHQNSFFFDEKEKMVYVSFKNIDRIIKIKYPEGNVISTYGQLYSEGKQTGDAKLFCGQHACKYSQLGCLFLYNNNGCSAGGAPKIKQFREMNDANHSLEKLWEYDCPVDVNEKKEFTTGGNVIELPGNDLFVCMGGTYSKLFIVGMDKKLLWSALPEHLDGGNKTWDAMHSYRASIITDTKLLEKFVWSVETKADPRFAVGQTGRW